MEKKMENEMETGIIGSLQPPVIATSLYGIRQELMVAVRSNLACFSR